MSKRMEPDVFTRVWSTLKTIADSLSQYDDSRCLLISGAVYIVLTEVNTNDVDRMVQFAKYLDDWMDETLPDSGNGTMQ